MPRFACPFGKGPSAPKAEGTARKKVRKKGGGAITEKAMEWNLLTKRCFVSSLQGNGKVVPKRFKSEN